MQVGASDPNLLQAHTAITSIQSRIDDGLVWEATIVLDIACT